MFFFFLLFTYYGNFNLVFLSIYLYTWLVSPLKESSQYMGFRVQGDFTFPSLSVPFLFIGENTEEGLPRLLTPSLFVLF